MRKVLLIPFLFLLVSIASAQEPIVFEKVFKADSISKDAIFSKVSEWIASEFIGTDGDYYSNRQDGVITKDYQFQYKYGNIMYKAYDGHIRCKIKVFVKDNRFKVTFSNFIHKAIPQPNQMEDFSMLLITNAETSGKKGINKSSHDKVWKSLKDYCKQIAEKNFAELENLKFKEDNW